MRFAVLLWLLPAAAFPQTVRIEGGPAPAGIVAPAAGDVEALTAPADAPSLGLAELPAGESLSPLSGLPAETASELDHPAASVERGLAGRALAYPAVRSSAHSARPTAHSFLRAAPGRSIVAPPARAREEFSLRAETLTSEAFAKLSAGRFHDVPAVEVPVSRALGAAPERERQAPAEPIQIVHGREAAPSGGGPSQPADKKPIGLLHLTLLGVNSIVGSGVYLFPGKMAALLGPASIVPFGMVGLLLVSVGLCFAEASTYFRRDGGAYLYARAAFGETAGYAVGWMAWVASMFGWATVASAVASYLSVFHPVFAIEWVGKAVAVGVVALMSALNVLGAKQGARTSSFFTAAKLLPLAAFVGIALWSLHAHGASFAPFAPHGWGALGAAASSAFFAFQGFENVPVPAGKVDQPSKNVPRAVILSLIIAGVLYMAVQTAAVGAFPGLAASSKPLADAAFSFVGPAGAFLMALGAVLSMVGFNAGTAMVTPRFLSSLAEDGKLPKGLAAIHKKFGTPHRAILLTAGVVSAMILLLDFGKLVDFTNVVICSQYLAACLAVPLLRRKLQAPKGAFRVPGGWLIPLLGAAATFWLGAQGGLSQLWWALGLLGAGLAVRKIAARF
jgi:amino acid transporter